MNKICEHDKKVIERIKKDYKEYIYISSLTSKQRDEYFKQGWNIKVVDKYTNK